MNGDAGQDVRELVDAVYRAESRRVLATLIRLLGDFDRAEEALHDAFRAALEQWPRDGMPSNPRTWLVSAGRTPRTGRVQGAVRGEAGLREGARRSDGGLPLRVESIARGVPPG